MYIFFSRCREGAGAKYQQPKLPHSANMSLRNKNYKFVIIAICRIA